MNIIANYFRARLADSVTVVVRSVDERTAARCVELLAEQIPAQNIFVVQRSPFAAALKEGLEIGIAQNRKWTLAVDADVLAAKDVILRMFIEGEFAPPHVFEIHSQVLDKFFGGVRFGGMKLYRTALLPKAIPQIPAPGDAKRPEATIIKYMHKNGHPFVASPIVAGVHDFEQRYTDIFRKGYTHAAKSDAFMPVLLPFWKREAAHDDDFKVLLAGIDYALNEGKLNPQLDVREMPDDLEELIASVGVQPKPEQVKAFANCAAVTDYMRNFESPAEYSQVARMMADNMPSQSMLLGQRLGRLLARWV